MNDETCTVANDNINVYRSKSIERGSNDARASSVDSCLQKSTGDNVRQSRSRVRNVKTGCSDAKQHINDHSPSEVRSDILAPTKFKFKPVNRQSLSHVNSDSQSESNATEHKQKSTKPGTKNDSNNERKEAISADNRGERNQDSSADNFSNPVNTTSNQ